MKSLTVELIAKSEQHIKKRRGMSLPQYLKTLLTLDFSNKKIDEIGDLSVCKNLTVVYIDNNHLTKIWNLDFATNLTYLDLSNNNIGKMENLSSMRKLTDLHLGGNRISVVEGLEELSTLQELYLQNQQLKTDEKFSFKPTSLLALAESLCVLNISGNNVKTIKDLSVLKELQHFSAANNNLIDIEELEDVIELWPQLLVLDLSENPVCKERKYRDRLIVTATKLETLDGKDIHEINRQFLLNWKVAKEATRSRKEKQILTGSKHAYPPNDFDLSQCQNPGLFFGLTTWKLQTSVP
ncbi:protein phosphatase 1 regulatory subunit 42 [Anableps anableps]